jgi:serine/arginine repetitive matrix protein 2
VKDLTARPPDPEHLKAVWSQVSEKSNAPTSNSLKAIADDLTAIPFTLQDVKSEDGGTPPPRPGSGGSSRTMSLQDVTRAFQVPSAPAAQQPSSSSPQSNAPQANRPSYGYTPPAAPNAIPQQQQQQPMYSPYPPPIMTATGGYSPQPSPGARPMMQNGHAAYPQPMWIPMGSAPPTPGAGARPRHSPYGAPMMYAPPGYAPAVHSPLAGAGRGRGMPLPMPQMPMPPMYGGSPVQMHGYPSPLTPGQGPPMQLMPHGVPSPRPAPAAASPYGQPPAQYARAPW